MRFVLIVAFVTVACGKSDPSASKEATKDLERAKSQQAKLVVQRYAFEAFPMWAMNHVDKACPSSMAELDEAAGKPAEPDPWGNAYVMKCGADLPAGAKGIAISSNGPDGKPGTDDDVRSWDK